ncbi:hypothetical protein MKW94_017209 [Papaver nudicaule]|uniref:RecQ-mediated genome instability protein 1 n=1 Tax=Papaver nudicaule TaxID=74823 RepID=A0AA42B5X0_PAPNU|nr:hypothetical protein [Papaver nudicaule]
MSGGNANPNPNRTVGDFAHDVPPRSNREQNQEQSFQDVVAEKVLSLFPVNVRSKLREELLVSCCSELNDSNLSFDNFNHGVLPENIHTVDIAHPGPLVLQVNKITELSVPATGNDKCLLLTMTDGVGIILGIVIKPIKHLQVSGASAAGFKVVIRNAYISNGILRLVPEGVRVLAPTSAAWKAKTLDEIVKDNSNRLSDAHKELPYRYLDSLLEQWEVQKKAAAVGDDRATTTIRGKIQGFMFGLTSFKFAPRPEYELVVYFQDGSCTSEILIHHSVVQRQIGLSPEEVTEYLNSSVGDEMWETMMEYKLMLSTLQCTLVVEINNDSDVPVAVELDSAFDVSWVREKLDESHRHRRNK